MTSSSDGTPPRRPSFAERVAAEGDQPRPGYQPSPLLRRASDKPGFRPSFSPDGKPDQPFTERRRAPDPVGAAAPAAEAAPRTPYSRFIPREELEGYASWQPNSFGGAPSRSATPAPDPVEVARQAREAAARQAAEQAAAHAAQVRQAREGGYQDGYRDGLAALEAFKQAHAAQTGAQVAALLQSLQTELDALEQNLAQRVAGVVLEMARQVVRNDLRVHPEHVVAVAQEALGTLLVSAKHITLRVHPDDLAMLGHAMGESLKARGARLVADAQITRGGCLVMSDIGVVDARIETRWERAAAAQGRPAAFDQDASLAEATPDDIEVSGDADEKGPS